MLWYCCSLLLALTYLTTVPCSEASETFSEPFGFLSLNIIGTNGLSTGTNPANTPLALGITRVSEHDGSISELGSAYLVDAEANWATGRFDRTNGPCYLEITSGDHAGLTVDISTSTSNRLDLAEDISSFASVGQTYRIRKHWTLGTVFGPENEAGLKGGTTTTADQLNIWDSSVNGFTKMLYYQTSGLGGTGWRRASSLFQNASNTVLYLDQGILATRRVGTNLLVRIPGMLKLGPTIIPVGTNGYYSVGYNYLANVYAYPLSLNKSGLYTTNTATGLAGGASTNEADYVAIYDVPSQQYRTYYYRTNSPSGWREVTDPFTDVGNTPLPMNGSFFVHRHSSHLPFSWIVQQPFESMNTGGPRIAGVALSDGGSFSVNFSSTATDVYSVYSATNLGSPTLWVRLTNLVGQAGSTTWAQAVCSAVTNRCYRIGRLAGDADEDGDDLANAWEVAHGLDPFDPSDAVMDPDDDGYTNLQEYNAATNPNDPRSHPADIPPYLVAWWRFDEGTGIGIRDSSLNGYNGSLLGDNPNSCWITGVVGSAVTFVNASTNWVEIPYKGGLMPTQAYTITGWVKLTQRDAVMNNWDPNTDELNFWLDITLGGFDFVLGNSVEDSIEVYMDATNFPLNSLNWILDSWHHLAVTYDRTNIRIFVDGMLVTNVPRSATIAASQNPVLIGFPDAYFDGGAFDDIRIYSRALNQSDIAGIYLSANPPQMSRYTQDGAITISPTLKTPFLLVSLDPTMADSTLIDMRNGLWFYGSGLYVLPLASDNVLYDVYVQQADYSTNAVGPVIHKTVVFDRPRVVVSNHVLVVWNTNSAVSAELKDYYLAHRPGFADANVLAIGCPTNEVISPEDCRDGIEMPIVNWLTNHPAKPIRYIVMAGDIATGVSDVCPQGVCTNNVDTVVAYALKRRGIRDGATFDAYLCGTSNPWQGCTGTVSRFSISRYPGMTALITHLWMGDIESTRAYIDKLAAKFTGNPIISAGYTNCAYFFDGSGAGPGGSGQGVIYETATARIFYASTLTSCTNVSGYFGHGVWQGRSPTYPINGELRFVGESDWFVIQTAESYNGTLNPCGTQCQGNFKLWFSATAFGGTNYLHTPVGAVGHSAEPGVGGPGNSDFFGMWERGWTFAEAAWISRNHGVDVAFGDPLVQK